MTEKCLVGRLEDSQCGSHIFFKDSRTAYESLDTEDQKNLYYRVQNFPAKPVGDICAIHMKKYLLDYSDHQKYCCDPFDSHTKRKGTRLVTLNLCETVNRKLEILIPSGHKLCIACSKEVKKKLDEFDSATDKVTADHEYTTNADAKNSQVSVDSPISDMHNIMEPSINTSESESQASSSANNQNKIENTPSTESSLGFVTESQEQILRERGLKRILDSIELPMPKKVKLGNERRDKMCEQLAEKIYKESIIRINTAFQSNLNVHEMSKLKKDSKALEQIMSNIVSVYKNAKNVHEKIKALTLLPTEYNFIDVKKYLDCTRYMLRKANDLRLKHGVLAEPPRKKITHYSDELINSIIDYYRDDKNSRPCSNAKDCIKVKHWKTKEIEEWPKKFLLYTLKELYHNWTDDHIQNFDKIPGFSFFASLRPDDCVLAGDPGTHTICLCCEHQNTKLKVKPVSSSLDYKVLLEASVCSVDDEDCMLGNCLDCPGERGVREYLETHELIKKTGSIIYNTWAPINIRKSGEDVHSGTRVTLIKKIEDVQTFYEGLISDILKLRRHHYVTETQKYCYTYLRDNLDYGEGLLDMDFSENYTFISQDSVQAFYYNNIQATLHPFVLYYRSSDGMKIECATFCIISDHLKHNASVVHLFQEKVLEIIKTCYPWVKKLIYFSDGAPTQYKNKNNFTNICHHKEDFDIFVLSYNFFATSHGKGPCDGIGALAKRIVRTASLRLPAEQQILTPYDMFQYLDKNMTKTKFIWVSSKECEAREKKLMKRFNSAQTVENTRQYHHVKPIDKKSAEFKVTTLSDDLVTACITK